MICDEEQLFKLTMKRRLSAQLRALRFLGLEHKVRADGTVVVLILHVEHLLGGLLRPCARAHSRT